MIARRLQLWARLHTEQDRYSPVGVLFHWTVAALVVFQLWWGWRAGELPVGADKIRGYALHAEVGLFILVVTVMRMAWRVAIPGPENDADKPGWQSTAAHVTHYAFYACLVGLPLSGWAMWSAGAPEQPLRLFGAIPWPHLPLGDLPPPLRWAVMSWSDDLHGVLVLALFVLVPLHAAAALKHHLWDRDDVLAGMLPVLKPPRERADRSSPRRRPTRREFRRR